MYLIDWLRDRIMGVMMSKYSKYLKYVIRHRWYVLVECCKLGIPWRGLIHDISKFMPDEFFAYTEAFYGKFGYNYKPYDPHHKDTKPEDKDIDMHKKVMDRFDKAWLIHQKRNPHHWQFWLLHTDDEGLHAMDMPDVFIKEMVADWRGAGRAITGKDNVRSWYTTHISDIHISTKTRKRVEELIAL